MMTANRPIPSARRERASFSDKETAKTLGITVIKLYRICKFFDSDPDDPWDLIQGDFFDYAPGQARKRRFYEEGVMAIAKYLEETEGASFLAKLNEFFTHHRARVTRALVTRRIIQVTQDRSAFVIRGELLFLDHRSLVQVLGTNGKGMAGTIRRIEEECAGLEGAEGLQKDLHYADIDGKERRHWSQRGLVRLAKTMHEKGRISKARKAWVKAVEEVGEECLKAQLKFLESHEARVRAAKARVRKNAKKCAVTQQEPTDSDSNPIELDIHHLFDADSRPDLAALDDNLLAINSSLHRNFHKWMAGQPCKPEDFVDYLLSNELTHFEGSARSQAKEEQRLQSLINKLELLQSRFEGNRLLY